MKLIVISNRLPVTVEYKNGKYSFEESMGGLVSGISAYLSSMNTSSLNKSQYYWIGWPGIAVQDKDQEYLRNKMKPLNLSPVFIEEKTMDRFYNGFCNKTLWPLFHSFHIYTTYDNDMWENYKLVNSKFCEVVLDNIDENDIIWIHDYHLMLLPKLLRDRKPDLKIGFFLHIPFPHFETFRLLPSVWSKEILNGLLGSDMIGFHTYDYTKYFFGCVSRILGLDNNLGEIQTSERIIKADTFPMGIDYQGFENLSKSTDVINEIKTLRNKFQKQKIILSIDRLDYTKGILNRLQGFQLFLEQNPEWKGKVILLAVVVPSRIGVDKYSQMKEEIDEIIGTTNGTYGTDSWMPVIYQYKYCNLKELSALYNISDIALITPLRDGMNLIAKEYLVSKTDDTGVLILSEMAGAAKELIETLMINPNHIEDIAASIKTALEMQENEQIKINKILKGRLKSNTVVNWADNFIISLMYIKSKQTFFNRKLFDVTIKNKFMKDFRKARKKIIFLDYDGTLVPFSDEPKKAEPDPELLNLLDKLTLVSGVYLVLISGREKNFMEEWFWKIRTSLIAEHGVWVRKRGKNWKLLKRVDNKWKNKLKPVLLKYTDLLPGSFIEEKSYSLTWHYRKADAFHANIVTNDLIDNLYNLTANMDIQVLQGSKVIEIKSANINKGTAILDFQPEKNYDFVLSIGDDRTDEDMFKVLSEKAYTIKVGISKSFARFNLFNYSDVRNLIKEMTDEK
jgi:trehalose 6-phosphate synthase/phosphatase